MFSPIRKRKQSQEDKIVLFDHDSLAQFSQTSKGKFEAGGDVLTQPT
jgi:hypothetical protein